MSGGHLNYIQTRQAEDIVNNSDLLAEVEYISTVLSGYGEDAQKALAKNKSVLADLIRIREELAKIDLDIDTLRGVWRVLDYRGTNDTGDEDVRNVLRQFNEANKE